jgi:hypothetical protein
MKQLPTRQRIEELLSFNRNTGVFTWIDPADSEIYRVKSGDKAGTLSGGYVVIQIDGVAIQAHRVAYFLEHGSWPLGEIDHIDGVRSNNKPENLRDVPHQQNMQNETRPRKSSATKILGVHLCKKTGKYRSTISINGKSVHLGRFDTAELASEAYKSAKRANHSGATI